MADENGHPQATSAPKSSKRGLRLGRRGMLLITVLVVVPVVVCVGAGFALYSYLERQYDPTHRGLDVEANAAGENLDYASSCESLQDQLEDYRRDDDGGLKGFLRDQFSPPTSGVAQEDSASDGGGNRQPSFFTETNVQVEGIDEGDVIKTNGKILATIDQNTRQVHLATVFPTAAAAKFATIYEEGENPVELLLYKDKLVVISQIHTNPRTPKPYDGKGSGSSAGAPAVDGLIAPDYFYSYLTGVRVYELDGEEKPELVREVDLEGTFRTSRLKGDHLYLINNTNVYDYEQPIPLLRDSAVDDEDFKPSCDCDEVAILDRGYYYPSFTSVLTLELSDLDEEAEVANFVGNSDTVYMSYDHIYFASNHYRQGFFPGPVDNYTVVNKIAYDDSRLKFVGEAKFNGNLLNQFSLDEHEGHLRLVGTLGSSTDGKSENYLLIFDRDMEPTAQIRDLAHGESIYSARFNGDTGVMVTFKKVDPLFVFDLSDPKAPKLKGELKIPGYSDYLHFVDGDTIIGVGKDAVAARDELVEERQLDFAWYQGLKIAVFDISEPEEPRELSNLILGDRGTESFALRDHRAFVFDRRHNLIIIPALIAKVDRAKCTNEGFFRDPNSCYGQPVSQGAQVIELNSADKLKLRGEVSHYEGSIPANTYYSDYDERSVKRSLVIDDVLVTVSSRFLKFNEIDNLSELKVIDQRAGKDGRPPIIID